MADVKTFSELKVGDTLYFGTLDSSHIMESKLISIEMMLSDDNKFNHNSNIRFTPVEFGFFDIPQIIMKYHRVVYYEYNNTGFWCGTTKEGVRNAIIIEMTRKRDLWQNRIDRLMSNEF